MTAAISGIKSGLGYGYHPTGSMSTYMEDGSIFGNVAMPYAFGGYNSGFFNNMANASDNMTSFAFKNRSNQHVLGSFNEIAQKNLSEMASALREGKSAKAAMLYNEVYEAVSKNYGQEITTQEERVVYDQSIKATIANLYQQINGYPLANDIKDNGEGYFENGFLQGVTLFNHSTNSSEELESYMLGTGIEGYKGKQVAKTAGKVVGSAVSLGAMAGVGATIGTFAASGAVGGPLGAVIGAGLGILVAAGSAVFSGSKPVKVTEAY